MITVLVLVKEKYGSLDSTLWLAWGITRKRWSFPPGEINIVATRAYGRSKYGIGLNIEQELSDNVGMMFRAGWNDGHNETWMFTEIDQSVSAGIVYDGKAWNRAGDNHGIAVLANGISAEHRPYLKAGGYGFLIGDGNLNYAPESIAEAFYSFSLPAYHLQLSPDYQFVLNPAYNKDRGPVHVVAIRIHSEFLSSTPAPVSDSSYFCLDRLGACLAGCCI